MPRPLPLPREHRRIRLRALREDDFAAFHGYRNDAVVARWQGWSPMDADDARIFLRTQGREPALANGGWVQLGIALREDDRLIGDLGVFLSEAGDWVEFGISLERAAQGHGYATEAVEALIALVHVHAGPLQVRARCDERNAACRRLLEGLGMRHVDTVQATYKGEVCIERHYHLDEGPSGIVFSGTTVAGAPGRDDIAVG